MPKQEKKGQYILKSKEYHEIFKIRFMSVKRL